MRHPAPVDRDRRGMFAKLNRPAALCALSAVLLLAGCDRRETNFSQAPGFAEYFAAHPRGSAIPDAAERTLLERHRPRLFLPVGNEGPIDFYQDYVAAGTLYDESDGVISETVTRAILNAHRDRPRVVFVHRPERAPRAPTPVVYARIDRAPVGAFTGREENYTFLTYNATFRVSGLPAGMAWWQELGLGLVASLDDWHQLDHYTAATIVLDGALTPIALMVQQHNNVRTHLIGRDVPAMDDGRVAIDVAIRSNELYPHRPERVVRRAVPMGSPENLRYLISGEGGPWIAADDITEPAREIDYRLDFLPPDDAYYGFAGFLGARRALQGRSGPPGADYNTSPRLKDRPLQLFAYYLREGHRDDLARLGEMARDPAARLDENFARVQARAFLADRGCLQLARNTNAAAC